MPDSHLAYTTGGGQLSMAAARLRRYDTRANPGSWRWGILSPMSGVKQLYGLQEIDLKLVEAEIRRESLLSKLADRSEFLSAAERLERLEKRSAELSARSRAFERLVAEVDQTLERLDERLYGGGVTNPQQLAAAQEERAFTSARKKEAEDQLLETMIDLDELDPVLTEARETSSKLQKERPGLERAWRKEEREAASQIEALRADREALLPTMPGNLLPLYESLRKSKSGRAMALVERGTCQGCRLSLTTQETQRARRGQQIVQCSSCGRILYAP